jgi:hypothetical protein
MDARAGDPLPRLASVRPPVTISAGAVPIAPPYGLTSADALAPDGRIRYDAK